MVDKIIRVKVSILEDRVEVIEKKLNTLIEILTDYMEDSNERKENVHPTD